MLHLIGEVPTVKLDFKDGLVQVLKLRESKHLGEQFEANRLKMNVLLKTGKGNTENLVVVESQVRDVTPTEPLGLICIRVGLDL